MALGIDSFQENCGAANICEFFPEFPVKLECVIHIFHRGNFHQIILEFRIGDALGQISVFFLGQGDHRKGFAEVGIGGGAHQQTQLGGLSIRVARLMITAVAAEPWSMTLAIAQGIHLRNRCVSQPTGLSSLRLHEDLSEVVPGASLQQVEGLAVVAAKRTETEITPADIGEMAMGTGHHKAHGHDGVLTISVLELLPVLDTSVIEMHQTTGAAGDAECLPVGDCLLYHRPFGEAQSLDTTPDVFGGILLGRSVQVNAGHPCSLAYQLHEPRFMDGLAAVVIPEVKAANQHRMVRKINHGARAMDLQHLAMAGLTKGRDSLALIAGGHGGFWR